MKLLKSFAAVSAAFCMLLGGCSGREDVPQIRAGDSFPQQGRLIQDFYPDKSAYRPGEPVAFTLELDNRTGGDFSGRIAVDCKHLDDSVHTDALNVSLKAGEKKSLTFDWTPPADDYRGYLAEATAVSGKAPQDHRNTAVDVSSSWNQFPRYGYLCKYPQMDQTEMEAVVGRLSKYHINGLQFYDWQDSHDRPLAGSAEHPDGRWKDIAGRDVFRSTVDGYLAALHKKNMVAANYNLMYGAYDGYEKLGIQKQWALYQDEKHETACAYPLPAGWESSLNLMNPASKGWLDYILGQEKTVFDTYGFDVFHIDTLGNQGYVYDYGGSEVNLAETYPDFLSQAKKQLGRGFVLNTVDEYGIAAAAASEADFLYTEVWPNGFPDYAGLQRAVYDNFSASKEKKAVVIAAYVNYGVESGEFNPNAVKLADAVLFASGASHLELGDTGMLSSEYFPNEKLSVPESLAADLRSYYDFLTAYENLLREPGGRKDFSGTIGGCPASGDGTAGTVWAFETDAEGYRTVNLINLLSRGDSGWRDDGGSCEDPETVRDLKVEIPDPGDVKGVFLASPDLYGGSMLKLDYTLRDGSLRVSVPSLEYWDALIVKTK